MLKIVIITFGSTLDTSLEWNCMYIITKLIDGIDRVQTFIELKYLEYQIYVGKESRDPVRISTVKLESSPKTRLLIKLN